MSLECAAGKCFGINTKIQMYNGTIKNIQDLMPNDLLMGDDGTPRKVINTCSGFGKLYKVKQENATSYLVNEEHILSVKDLKNNIYDLELGKNNFNNLYGYKGISKFNFCDDKVIDFYKTGYDYLILNHIDENILYNTFENRLLFLSGVFDQNEDYLNDYFIKLTGFEIFNLDLLKLINNLGLYYEFIEPNLLKIMGYNLNFLKLNRKKKLVNQYFLK